MATLYEISERYQNILAIAEDLEQDVLDEALSELDDELERKAEGYAQVIAELEHRAEGYEKHEKRFKERKEKAKKSVERMKKALQEEMERLDKPSIQTDTFELKIRKYKGSVEIKNEKEIPEEFWTEPKIVEAKPDKNKLYKFLKGLEDDGRKVEWATIKENKGLNIK